MPFVSCIILSHDKAAFVGEAIASVAAQTFTDWEAIVFDSGTLYDRGFYESLPVMKDPRIRLVRSWETEELKNTKTIASWCFNECFRKNIVKGQYVNYLCDDDLYYPNAFQTFHDYAQANPSVMAMYASIDLTGVTVDGEKRRFLEMIANEIKGSCCNGGQLDYRVDYMQLCHKAELVKLFPDDEYWPEDREVIKHADGIFLEKIGSYVPIYPINVKIGENRKVPQSLNYGGERLELFLRNCRLEEEKTHLQHAVFAHQAEILHLRQTLSALQGRLAYRVADRLDRVLKRVPLLRSLTRRVLLTSWQAWRLTKRLRPGRTSG